MENFGMNQQENKGAKTLIKILAFGVYAAGAIFATLAFTNEIESFFPDSPLMGTLAHIGAWSNMFSVLLMVWAKDYWVTGKPMYVTAVIGWGLEVTIMGLNVLASFGSDWANFWTGLSPATPVFVIALWGLLWIMHPDHKARQAAMQFQADAQTDFQNKLKRAMKSQRVQGIMEDGAAQAAQQYAEKTLGVVIDPTHGSGRRLPGASQATRDIPVTDIERDETKGNPTTR